MTAYTDVERVPILAEALERELQAAGISYTELEQRLQAERLRTLREKYPEFAAQFAAHDEFWKRSW